MQMNRGLLLCWVSWVGALSVSGAELAKVPSEIRLEEQGGKLLVRAKAPGGQHFELATYNCAVGKRPYLHPVYDAAGRQALTEDRPEDHPWQHGIFTGFHRVNGFNYWKEDEGRQRLVRISNVHGLADRVGWSSLIELVSPKGNVVLEEENTITIHAPQSPEFYLIDFNLLLRAKTNDVQFGKFFVGGLSVRMPWDKENPRQSHLNSNGVQGRAGEQQRAAWCTVERPFGDEVYGIAILDHPSNANHPPVWRVDEQGLINPNLSGSSDWSIPAGQERLFRYRLIVFRGYGTDERMKGHFEAFSREEGQ